MKITSISSVAMAALLLAACGGGAEPDASTTPETPETGNATEDQSYYSLDTDQSRVHWKGVMLGVKEHSGDLKFKPGSYVALSDGRIVGGELIVDMSTMTATDDWTYTEDYSREKLVGHLSSPDFFDVANHGEARLVLGTQKGNEVSGELTVRGKTNSESVTDLEIRADDNAMKGVAKLVFDRQNYDVTWSTGAQDMVLSDDIELTAEIKAYKK